MTDRDPEPVMRTWQLVTRLWGGSSRRGHQRCGGTL